MLPIELEYVLGEDRTSYEAMLAGLPDGDSSLKRGVVVPSHTEGTAQTLRFKNLVPNTSYVIDIQGEWESAPVPRVYFSPKASEHLVTVPLPYGPSTLYAKSPYHERRFFVSVTHYGTVLRTFAREITEYSKQPLTLLDDSVSESFAYRLALPLIAGMTKLIPSDLEFLGVLSHKLLIKNLLHRPGTNGAAREVLAAFCASNPVFHKMQNYGALNAPMYRSEETFAGHEAHVWVPNREIERWRAFSILIANLPQFYKIKAIAEGEVFFYQGGKLRRHTFDFDSPFANSVLDATGTFDCFLRLFKLSAAVESEHYLNFCQATYPLDSQILAPGLSSPDVDPLQITNWTGFSLTGRLEQQYGESWGVHRWVYESPLLGEINGVNRFFRLKSNPRSARSVKVWVDGLLQYLNVDYRVSLSSNTSVGSTPLGAGSVGSLSSPTTGPMMVTAMPSALDVPSESTQVVILENAEPRPFIGPVFTSLEVKGNAELQYVLTVGEQSPTTVQVIVSESPYGSPGGTDDTTQEVEVNYVAPALPAGAYPGRTQYGTQTLPVGTTSYYLEYPRSAFDTDYQLIVQLAVDPLPSGGAEATSQLVAMVKTHSLDGAMVELSGPVEDENTRLYWWLLEADGVAVERGTLVLEEGASQARLDFSNGPYLDKVTLIYQLWHTALDSSVATLLVSNKLRGPGGTYVQFSAPIPDGNYRLDWAVFSEQIAGESRSFLEFVESPVEGQLIEVQYDELWPYWGQGALSPPADGVRREFALPYPVAHEKSVYLTVNGHLATYGHNRQYTIDVARNIVLFSTPPSAGQVLWAVMPLVDTDTGILPSAWDQDFAFSRADLRGAFATATISGASPRLPVGTNLTVKGHQFTGVSPAQGTLAITGRVDATGSFIRFEELDVTLRGVLDPVDSFVFTTADVGVVDNTITKIEHGLENGRQITLDTASGLSSLPLGLNLGVTYYVVNATSNTLQLSPIPDGPPVDILTNGIGTFQLNSPNENLFPVNVSLAADGQALAQAINAHSVLSALYRAEVIGDGLVRVQAKTLGGHVRTTVAADALNASVLHLTSTYGLSDVGTVYVDGLEYHYASKTTQALYGLTPTITCNVGTVVESGSKDQTLSSAGIGLSVTNIVGDTSPSSYSKVTISNNEIRYSIPALDVAASSVTLAAHANENIYEGLAVKALDIGYGLPSGLNAGALYYIKSITTLPSSDLEVELSSSPSLSTSIDLGTMPSGYFNLALIGADGSRIFVKNNTFFNLERVLLTPLISEALPLGLAENQIYFVRNRTDHSFQLSESPTGAVVTFSPDDSQFKVVSLPSFPTNIGSDLDFMRLTEVLSASPELSDYFIDQVDNKTIKIRAKKIGFRYNGDVSATSSLSVQNLTGGHDATRDRSFAAGKVLYADEGTVLTLDGLSTRLYRPYSGNEFQFTYRPTTRQEPYYIGEVFPIDNHPLDSMMANEPCNYPNGVFTQGLLSQLTSHDFSHELESSLIINTTTLPFQETPSGTLDGVNRDFSISLASVAGKNSLLVFLDGIFQPSDTYEYSVTSSGGATITLSMAPSPSQKLWAWYIPVDTLRFEPSDVDAATGRITLPSHGLFSGQVVSLWASSGVLPEGLQAGTPYYVVNPMVSSFQLALEPDGTPLTYASVGIGVFRLNPSDNVLYERVEALDGDVDGVNQAFSLPHGPVEDRAALHLFLDGLYQLQGEDYLVTVGNDSVSYLSGLAPASGQTVWAHYNERALDKWRQLQIGVTDGVEDTFLIQTLLTSDLPTSPDSILLFLNGLCQRRGVDYSVLVDELGYPNGYIQFLGGAPEANRKIHVAYIKRG